MEDNKKLKKNCTILMIINIFLTFYIFGMPKVYENKLHFTRESEFKYIILSKNRSEKIKEFFSCYTCIMNLIHTDIPDTEFYKDLDLEYDD